MTRLLIAGGGHERGLRSGTENVPAIVGFGVAAELAAQRVAELPRRLKALQQRLESLTERERAVMDLVVAGLPNKLVADQLNISVRTVEVHRSRVFDKMGVKSAVELANALRP
mgnify:CR=1 FL=1